LFKKKLEAKYQIKIKYDHLEDSFQIINHAFGIWDEYDEDPSKFSKEDIKELEKQEQELRTKWDKSVKNGKLEIISIEEAKKFKFWDRKRNPDSNDPIVVGKIDNKNIVLDGSNRLGKAIRDKKDNIPVFLVNINWAEPILWME